MDTVIISTCDRSPVSVSSPVWRTAAATSIAYLVALGALFVLLFVGPYLLFQV